MAPTRRPATPGEAASAQKQLKAAAVGAPRPHRWIGLCSPRSTASSSARTSSFRACAEGHAAACRTVLTLDAVQGPGGGRHVAGTLPRYGFHQRRQRPELATTGAARWWSGTVTSGSSSTRHRCPGYDEVLRDAAAHAADAVELERLHAEHELALQLRDLVERQRARHEQQRALVECAKELADVRADPDRVLTLIVTQAQRLLGADMAYRSLQRRRAPREAHGGRRSARRPRSGTDVPIPFGTGVGGMVAATGAPFSTSDHFADDRSGLHSSGRRRLGPRGAAGVDRRGPVVAPRHRDRVLFAANREVGRFSHDAIALLGSFAALAALAIDQAHLLSDKERALAAPSLSSSRGAWSMARAAEGAGASSREARWCRESVCAPRGSACEEKDDQGAAANKGPDDRHLPFRADQVSTRSVRQPVVGEEVRRRERCARGRDHPPDAGPERDRHVLPDRGRRADHHPHARLGARRRSGSGRPWRRAAAGLGDDQGQHPVGVGADVGQLLRALHERRRCSWRARCRSTRSRSWRASRAPRAAVQLDRGHDVAAASRSTSSSGATVPVDEEPR